MLGSHDADSWLLTTEALRERRAQRKLSHRSTPRRPVRPEKRVEEERKPAQAPQPADQLLSPEKVVFGVALRKTKKASGRRATSTTRTHERFYLLICRVCAHTTRTHERQVEKRSSASK